MHAVVLVLVLGSAACAQMFAPDVGPPSHAPCANLDTDPDHDVSFSQDINPIIEEYHCRNCHTPGGPTPLGYLVGGLDLTSYDTLRAGGTRSGAMVIVPGMPCSSILIQKVSPGPPFGSRMPLDGPPYLDDEDVELISDWIVEGARDN